MDIEQLAEILFEAFALEHNLTASFANLGEARQQVWLAVAEAAHAHYAKPAASVVWPEPAGRLITGERGLFVSYNSLIAATPGNLYTRAQVEAMLEAQGGEV